jgi:hypothetical protein
MAVPKDERCSATVVINGEKVLRCLAPAPPDRQSSSTFPVSANGHAVTVLVFTPYMTLERGTMRLSLSFGEDMEKVVLHTGPLPDPTQPIVLSHGFAACCAGPIVLEVTVWL